MKRFKSINRAVRRGSLRWKEHLGGYSLFRTTSSGRLLYYGIDSTHNVEIAEQVERKETILKEAKESWIKRLVSFLKRLLWF